MIGLDLFRFIYYSCVIITDNMTLLPSCTVALICVPCIKNGALSLTSFISMITVAEDWTTTKTWDNNNNNNICLKSNIQTSSVDLLDTYWIPTG